MPQQFNVQGVGIVEFPDDWSQDEVLKAVNQVYGGKEKISGVRAFGEHALAEAGPSAAFMAAAGPGAAAGAAIGAAIPGLGETGLSELAGGVIGGMVTGIPAAWAARKAQKAALEAVDPGMGEELEQRLAAGAQQHPWASAAGGVASLAPSAKSLVELPFSMRQLPMRVALGAGLGAGLPMVTEGRLPTAPELVSGVAMGTLFGEARWAKTGAARPVATPEVREQRKQELLGHIKDYGLELEEGPLARPGDVINQIPGTNRVRVNWENFNGYLEKDRPSNVSPGEAIKDLIEHETPHGVQNADARAEEYWNNLTPYEQMLEKRRIHGPYYRGEPYTPAQYGAESIRFWTQMARNKSASELIQSTRQENLTSNFLTQVQKVVQWTRKNLGTQKTKEALRRNQDILDDVETKVAQAIKEAKYAVDTETAQVLRPVREPSREGEGEMPVAERLQTDDERRSEEAAQLEKLRKEKVLLGPATPLQGEEPIEAAYVDENGKVWYASNHPEALEKAGGRELSDQYPTRESRNTPNFGYRTNRRKYIPRVMAEQWAGFKYPHADEMPSKTEPGELMGDQKDLQTPPAEPGTSPNFDEAEPGQDIDHPAVGTALDVQERMRLGDKSHTVRRKVVRIVKGEKTKGGSNKVEVWFDDGTASGGNAGRQSDGSYRSVDETIDRLIRNKGQRVSPAEPGKAPPVVAQGAPEAAPAPGKAEAPGAVPPGAEPATRTISATPTVSKNPELVALERKLFGTGATKGGINMADLRRLTELSKQHVEAMRAAGALPQRQEGPPLAMSRKWKSGDELLEDIRAGNIPVAGAEKLVSIEKPDGTRYLASYDPKKSWDLSQWGEEMVKRYGGATKAASIGRFDAESPEGLPPWSHGILPPGHKIIEDGGKSGAAAEVAKTPPLAMTRKGLGEEMKPRDVVAELVRMTKGGKVDEQTRDTFITQAARSILDEPKEKWPAYLSEFQAQWQGALIQAAQDEIAAQEQRSIDALMAMPEGSIVTTDPQTGKVISLGDLSPESIRAALGEIDRKGLARRIVHALGQDPVPIAAAAPKPGKPGWRTPEPKPGTPVSRAVSPRYRYAGQYGPLWKATQQEHPEIPEWLFRDDYRENVNNFLANAPSETIMKLLRAARLETKFLAPIEVEVGGQKVVLTRHIPEPSLNPVLDDMAAQVKDIGLVAKELKELEGMKPEEREAYWAQRQKDWQEKRQAFTKGAAASMAFKRFLNSRNLTTEQGLDLLKAYDAELTRELQEAAQMGAGRESQVVAETKGKKKVFRSVAPRVEALSERDRAELWESYRKGREANLARRRQAVGALSHWLLKDSQPPERSAMRKTITAEDIWFDTKESAGAYAEYPQSTKLGDSPSFLKKVLAQGAAVEGKAPSRISRGVVVVVDRTTGTVHAVSTYPNPKSGEPYVYDPSGPVGSKSKNFISVNTLLAKYRVKAYMLVRDPLHRFQQTWYKGEGKTAEQKFDEDIGALARKREDASMAQWIAYQKRRAEELTAKQEAAHEARYGTKEEQAKAEEQTVREKVAQAREESGLRPWEEGEEFTMAKGNKVDPYDLASIEAWSRGPGRGSWGLFPTDPQRLVRGPMSGVEAEALYQWMKDNKVKSEDDLMKALQLMAGDRKLAEGFRERGAAHNPFYLRPRDYCAVSALQKMARRIYLEWVSGTGRYAIWDEALRVYRKDTTAQELLSRLPRLPKGFDGSPEAVKDLKPRQRERYELEETHRVIALGEATIEAYERFKDIHGKEPKPGDQKATGAALDTPPDAAEFRQRTLAQYGDTTRRDIEQPALRTFRTWERTGKPVPRVLGKVPKPGQPIPYNRLLQWAKVPSLLYPGRKFPTKGRPLPEEVPSTIAGAPPPQQVPRLPGPVPTVAGRGIAPPPGVKPEMFPGALMRRALQLPTKAGERREPFVPAQRPPGRNLLREPGTAQLMLRKIAEQSRGGKPLAFTRKGYGVADRYREEMAVQGRAKGVAPKPPALMTKEQEIAKGRDLVLSGKINPVQEMLQAKETGGYMTWQSAAAFRYWGYKLQQNADDIAAKSGGTKTKAYDEARKASDAWQDDIDATAKQQFARTGHVLQGWNQIGPDDMKSTTFVRREVRKAKAKREGKKEQDVELDEEDEADVDYYTGLVTKAGTDRSAVEVHLGEEVVQQATPKLDKGQQEKVKAAEAQLNLMDDDSSDFLRSTKPPSGLPMALKGESKAELPPLDADTERALGNIGCKVLAELSKAGKLTDANWLKEMGIRLRSEKVNRPDLEPYLEHIRAISEEVRDAFLNNFIGTGDAVKDARGIFTRKQPPIEDSIAAIRRALEADPSGRKITPAEAYHVFNYLRIRFFQEGEFDFRKIRLEASKELGIRDELLKEIKTPYPQVRLFRAISSNRSMRKLSDELLEKMRNETRIRSQATNWLKNQEYPRWLRTARAFPRLFFIDKILGHGLVPMITHASNMVFTPQAWGLYFGRPGQRGAWAEMYTMSFGEKPIQRLASKLGLAEQPEGALGPGDYHALRMNEIMDHPRFEFWKKAGLEADPFKYSDDYTIEALQNAFSEQGFASKALRKMGVKTQGSEVLTSLIGGRGFDALKWLRYARAEEWLKSLPEHLRNEESAALIADSVNHATGIVKAKFHESANWLLFAPKLEASRWAFLFRDTIKAAEYIRHWDRATLEQRAWAKAELKQKAAFVGMYFGMLALNQAFLKMSGSKEDINGPFMPVNDPSKPDFLAFKVHGFKVGIITPLIGTVRLLGRILHDSAFGTRTKFEQLTNRQIGLGEDILRYGRGKASPLASFAVDAWTGVNAIGRPLPWSRDRLPLSRQLRGERRYTMGEYLAETFTPIPLEEAIRETWRSQGVDDTTISRWLRAIMVSGAMGATGARLSPLDQ